MDSIVRGSGARTPASETLLWQTAFDPLLHLLEYTGCPSDVSAQLGFFFRHYLVPAISPTFPSFMTDDYTPMEMAIEPLANTVRFAIEPTSLANNNEARNQWMETLAPQNVMHPDTDLQWYRMCSEMLTLPRDPWQLARMMKLAGPNSFCVSHHGSPDSI